MRKREGREQAMDSLRRRAEKETAARKKDLPEGNPEELRRLLYELQVHRVELEMQNQELQETQQLSFESQQRYHELFDLAPVGYLTLDLHGRIKELNQAAVELLKLRSTKQALGTPLFLFVDAGSRDTYNAHTRQVSESLSKRMCELKLAARDGSQRSVRLETVPARNGDELIGLRCAVIDMTERVQAFEKLEETNRELHRKTAELRELSRQLIRIEHRERERLAALLHDHLQQILVAAKFKLRFLSPQESVDEVEKLLDQSLTVSRSLVTDLAPPVLLQNNLFETLRWLSRWAKEMYRLEVKVDAPASIQAASEEERILLFDIVRELLVNVSKHAGASQASVTVTPEGRDGIRILVADEGAGFEPEALLNQSSSSFGLLSIRHRLSWVGGTMRIDSAPGKGCRVQIHFPSRAHDKAPEIPQVSPRGAESISGRRAPSAPIRVLVADDHKILRQGLASIIEAEPDLEFIGEAEDGREAIELTRQLEPDVVIMDIEMPGTNGIEATKVIADENPKVRVIGLSMHTPEDMEHAMRAAGASAYLPKDGPAENLVDTIRRSVSVSAVRPQGKITEKA